MVRRRSGTTCESQISREIAARTSDAQNCAVSEGFGNSVANLVVREVIYTGSGFVQDQYLGVDDQGAGKRDERTLADAKIRPFRVDNRV